MKNLCIKISIAALLLSAKSVRSQNAVEDSGAQGTEFFPGAYVFISPLFITGGSTGFTSLVSADALFDLVHYRNLRASFSMKQDLFYSERDGERFSFDEIYYDLDYINIRYDSAYGALMFFADHRCTNFINSIAGDDLILRWYGLGAGWETHGNRNGKHGSGGGVELLPGRGYLNFGARVRKGLSTRNYPVVWSADLSARCDLYLADPVSLYVSGSAEYFRSEAFSWNRSAEGGFSLYGGDTTFSPYFRYEYKTDRRENIGGRYSLYGAGFRIESSIQGTEGADGVQGVTGRPLLLPPELHFRGSYSKYVMEDVRNYRTELFAAADLIRTAHFSLFLNGYIDHSSLAADSGMFPAFIDSYCETGISVEAGLFHVEPYARYREYDEGNIYSRGPYDYREGGVRIITKGMKTGYGNRYTGRVSGEGFAFINRFEFLLNAGRLFKIDGIDAVWSAEGLVRWDILGHGESTLYLSAGEKLITGDEGAEVYIYESGVRSGGGFSGTLFFRGEYNRRQERLDDVSRFYSLIGVRAEI